MSASPKPRGGQASELTRLKLLPPQNLEAVWSWREELVEGRPMTNAAIRNRIAKQFGVRLSLDKQLSQFWSWYSLKLQLAQNETVVETLLADFKSANPDTSPEQVQSVGQSFFTALALQQQDPKQWFLIQQTAIKKEQLSLDRSKFQRETCELFVKWTADKRASEIASSTASNADKIEKLGELMFGEDWK